GADDPGELSLRRGQMDAALPEEAGARQAEPGAERPDGQSAIRPPVRDPHGDSDAHPGADTGDRVLVAAGLDGDLRRPGQSVAMEDLLESTPRVGAGLAQDERVVDDLLDVQGPRSGQDVSRGCDEEVVEFAGILVDGGSRWRAVGARLEGEGQ